MQIRDGTRLTREEGVPVRYGSGTLLATEAARYYVGPTGPLRSPHAVGRFVTGPYLADRGFAGTTWTTHWQQDYHAAVLTHRAYGTAPAARRQHSGWRQRIEGMLARLVDTFHLPCPGARTDPGLLLRAAAKVAAFNVAVRLNHHAHRPPVAFAELAPC